MAKSSRDFGGNLTKYCLFILGHCNTASAIVADSLLNDLLYFQWKRAIQWKQKEKATLLLLHNETESIKESFPEGLKATDIKVC